jgi:divinyl protochlorophyllide a 8-vinyl-reductase
MKTDARMGPNAIIQIGTALRTALGAGPMRGLFDRAGLAGYLDTPPQDMVAESEVIHLHAVLRRALAPPLAQRVARDAGIGTGNYLLRHRIPNPAQKLLRATPRRIANRLLVAAIVRHSWTFQGSGRLRATAGPPPVFILEHCAICRGAQAAAPLCSYYAATFERLFQELVDPASTVIETECAAVAGGSCRFEVRWR